MELPIGDHSAGARSKGLLASTSKKTGTASAMDNAMAQRGHYNRAGKGEPLEVRTRGQGEKVGPAASLKAGDPT
jgi:hypothetical protein